MKIDEMIAVLQAAKEGKKIQIHDGHWRDCDSPAWDFAHFIYRVKLPTEGTHAEEQWTEETVRMIIADVPVGDAPEIIAAAHNAAIEKADTESYREGVAAGIATTLQEQQPKASPSHCPACNGDELAKIGDEWVECPGIQPKSE